MSDGNAGNGEVSIYNDGDMGNSRENQAEINMDTGQIENSIFSVFEMYRSDCDFSNSTLFSFDRVFPISLILPFFFFFFPAPSFPFPQHLELPSSPPFRYTFSITSNQSEQSARVFFIVSLFEFPLCAPVFFGGGFGCESRLFSSSYSFLNHNKPPSKHIRLQIPRNLDITSALPSHKLIDRTNQWLGR